MAEPATAAADGDEAAREGVDDALASDDDLVYGEAVLRLFDAPGKSVDEILAEAAEASRNAAAHGTPPGSRAKIDQMKRKWCRFVEMMRNAGRCFEASEGPSVAFVLEFAAFLFNNRDIWSAAGRKGLGKRAKNEISGCQACNRSF